MIGKAKTTAQMVAITLLLLSPVPIDSWVGLTGIVLLYLSAFLTLWSMYVYLKAAWAELTPFNNPS